MWDNLLQNLGVAILALLVSGIIMFINDRKAKNKKIRLNKLREEGK